MTSKTGEVLLCAVGVSALLNQTCASVSTACILCQENSSNEAMEMDNSDKSFVLAACIQRSSVLRRQGQKIDNGMIREKIEMDTVHYLWFCRFRLFKWTFRLEVGNLHWWVWSCHAYQMLEQVSLFTFSSHIIHYIIYYYNVCIIYYMYVHLVHILYIIYNIL